MVNKQCYLKRFFHTAFIIINQFTQYTGEYILNSFGK